MGVEGAAWLDRPEREAEEAPSKAIAALSIAPGSVVADVGAGSGYYTVRLSQVVGPRGRVVATDLQPGMLDLIRAKVERHGLTDVTLVQGRPDDPALPAATFDLIVMVDVYHELAFPYEVMTAIRKSLKPGGRVVLVEFRKEDPKVPIKEVHKMSEEQIKKEMAVVGLAHLKTDGRLPWQHIAIFTKK